MESFNTVHQRKNTRSLKWDMLQSVFKADDLLPMWVADMDFKPPEAVNDALIKRAKHGIYGYTNIDNDVKEPIVNWLQKRHHWEINPNWLTFSPGVVTSLHIAVQAFSKPNDKVLIQTPVYTPFYDVIESHERTVVKNSLILKDNYYQIDFVDFEEKLKQGIKIFILCSPHNPVGRVWTADELKEMARLCLKYDVLILSDEIHGDLIYPGYQHIPIASLSQEISEQTITCMSPSKTFNLAGLQASYLITENKEKRDQLDQHFLKQGLNTLNTMGNLALEAAYRYGEPWLEELINTLNSHQKYVIKMFEAHTPELKVIRSEGTYLLWIDCSGLNMDNKELHQFMIDKAKIGLNPGTGYGEEGDQFMRINIACPQATLEDGINRIINAVRNR